MVCFSPSKTRNWTQFLLKIKIPSFFTLQKQMNVRTTDHLANADKS